MHFILISDTIYLVSALSVIYFLFSRFINMYYKKWFYEKQGVKFAKECYPIFGNLLRLRRIYEASFSNITPTFQMIKEDFGDNPPKIIGIFTSFQPTLWITDLQMISELYQTKNKIFEKHSLLGKSLKPLLGNTFILSESSNEFLARREMMSLFFN